MLNLEKFKITEREVTSNWSNIILFCEDVNGKIVRVCQCSYATGALPKFPYATKKRAEKNINNLKNYLIKNNIDTHQKWVEQLTDVRIAFWSAFGQDYPEFAHY